MKLQLVHSGVPVRTPFVPRRLPARVVEALLRAERAEHAPVTLPQVSILKKDLRDETGA